MFKPVFIALNSESAGSNDLLLHVDTIVRYRFHFLIRLFFNLCSAVFHHVFLYRLFLENGMNFEIVSSSISWRNVVFCLRSRHFHYRDECHLRNSIWNMKLWVICTFEDALNTLFIRYYFYWKWIVNLWLVLQLMFQANKSNP